MAYPGDIDENTFEWKASAPSRRVRRPPDNTELAPVRTSVAITAIGLVFASLLAGAFLTLVLFAPTENHTAAMLTVDVVAGR